MGLLNRTRAPKQAKVACPSCGKPNPAPAPGAAVRCVLCACVLPVPPDLDGGAIEVPWKQQSDVRIPRETDEQPGEVLSAEPDDERSPLTDLVVEDYVPFDMDGLSIGEPALPRPSTND